MSEPAFVVRTLPTTSLKGAFRVHISPESLLQLHLKVGELCTIIGEDGTRGTGIAWRALDKMGSAPKSQSVKMSEVLREAFGFKQGSQVRIEKATHRQMPVAKRISVSVVSPVDYEGPDDGRTRMHIIHVLAGCEAIAAGTTFDVGIGEGHKKRFFVEHIDSEPTQDQHSLYDIRDSTEVRILDGPPSSPHTITGPSTRFLNAADFGGLQTQIEELNARLEMLCYETRSLLSKPVPERAILIHGFEGTGKSMLLDALSKSSSVKRVIRINNTQLHTTPSKASALIKASFEDALAATPSLFLIDDLDELVGAGDSAVSGIAGALIEGFQLVRKSQVLIVGTARSTAAINTRLLSSGQFRHLIELPIPGLQGRREILSTHVPQASEAVISAVASSTHGFTGGDLADLSAAALHMALRRHKRESEAWNLNETSRTSSNDTSNDRAESVASTLVERPSTTTLTVTLADFEDTLPDIKPSALREVIVEPPKMTFDDIGGSAALKARFDRLIMWPIERPDLYALLSPSRARKGMLLYGPPGCSKTMTAQAVASTYGWNFVAIKGAELISMYVGESERAIRDIFRKARQAAPTIIFFDELDSIAGSRSTPAGASHMLNVVTTLLTEMDGFQATREVLVLAATNRPASLDPAILRPGRFDEHIYLGLPDAAARLQILRICTSIYPNAAILVEELVPVSEGLSGAEIKNACLTAEDLVIERALADGVPTPMTTEDLRVSLAKATRGVTREMLQTYEDFAMAGKAID